MNRFTLIKLSAFALFLALGIFLGLQSDGALLDTLRELPAKVEQKPFQTAALFLFLFVLLKFTFIPLIPVALLSGYIFGPLWGAFLAILAMTLSSILMFILARYLGKDFVREVIENRFEKMRHYNHKLKHHGFLTVLFLRVVPVMPLAVVNMGLGLSRVRFADFSLATVVGVTPGILLLSFAGEYLMDWKNPALYFFLGAYLLLLLTTGLVAFWYRK